ncbi:MAG: universal stress protein [Planctomycetia bacterium]|nr:universal stress protein [Planctomycetia bacterium]
MVPARNILVPTNYSESAGAALEYAKQVAAESGATLHILHAVEDFTSDSPMLTAVDLDGIREQVEGASLDRLKGLLSAEDRNRLHVEYQVVRESAYEAIMEYARSRKIDLIVLGNSSRSAFAQFIMGSIAESIVRNAPCPVLTVKVDDLIAA